MSLRSRTLRARLLRLSRRAMRLTIRPAGGEARTTGLPHLRFSRLLWRRARAPRLLRERAAALHLHESHFLIRPDVRVSVQMYLAAASAARRAATVLPQLAWRRSPERPQEEGARSRRPGARLLAEPLLHRARSVQPLIESPAPVAFRARRLAAGALMSWPARAVERASATERSGHVSRHAALLLPAMRRNRARSGATEQRPVREHFRHHESSFLPHLVPSRLRDPESHGIPLRGLRSSTFPPAVRLRRRERTGAVAPSGSPIAWREVARVPLHYATPKASTPPVAHPEPQAAAAAPPTAHPPQPSQSTRAVFAPVLDRAATDRLADEVIRRIERRVRVERERRGI